MAMKIEEAMDMSLDDYIAMSKNSNDVAASASTNRSSNHTTSSSIHDAKFGRRSNIEDEEEEEEIDILKEEYEETSTSGLNDTGVWKGPDSSTTYLDCNTRQNDLRERLNNNSGRKQVSAVQCRLMAPNISADRPRGIPTLLPLDAYVKRRNNGYNNQYRNRSKHRNRNRGFFNNNSNNNSFAGNGMWGVNNGRIQRNRNQDLSKNMRFNANNNGNQYNDSVASQGSPRNLIIECSRNNLNIPQSSPLNNSFQRRSNTQDAFGNKSMPIGNLTPQAQAALNLNSNSNQISDGNDNSLKSVLGFQGNVSGDMMPVFAARLMDLIKNNSQAPVHKPIYDMKIQKDIHAIQNKPLLYKCPGGDVVSSDGAGVNCEIIPCASGISLNCRFA